MLSSKQIAKIAKSDAQYGPPEQSFSPSWHEDQARNGMDHAPSSAVLGDQNNAHNRVVQVILGHIEDPKTGDVRIAQYKTVEERDADPLRIKDSKETLEPES